MRGLVWGLSCPEVRVRVRGVTVGLGCSGDATIMMEGILDKVERIAIPWSCSEVP